MKNKSIKIFTLSCIAGIILAFGVFALFFWGIAPKAKITVTYRVNNCGPANHEQLKDEHYGVYDTKKYRKAHKFESRDYDSEDAPYNTGWFTLNSNGNIIKLDSSSIIENSTVAYALYGTDEEIFEYMTEFTSVYKPSAISSYPILFGFEQISETEKISHPYKNLVTTPDESDIIWFDIEGTLNDQEYSACVQILDFDSNYPTVCITVRNTLIETSTVYAHEGWAGTNKEYDKYYVKTVYSTMLEDGSIPHDFKDEFCNRACSIVEEYTKNLHHNLFNVWWTKDCLK